MGGVAEGEEEADRHRLGVELREGVEVELLDDSGWARTLVDADAALQGHERLRMAVAEPVQVRARLAAEVQDVLEPGGADERRARALPLEQRVGRDRRPVREAVEEDVAGAHLDGGLHDRVLLRPDGRDLRDPELAVVEQHGVREGASDVDPEDRHAALLPRPPDD